MSTQERNDHIAAELQNLIRNLIDPNVSFKILSQISIKLEYILQISPRELLRHEQMAWRLIRNDRFMSTNSHDVSRRLAALVERFRVENMSTFGDTVKDLCDKILSNPDHEVTQSEQDVLWSLLDFVLEMTNEPVQNIRRNRGGMDRRRVHVLDAVDDAERLSSGACTPSNAAEGEIDWVALLSEDFLPPLSPGSSSSDNLSVRSQGLLSTMPIAASPHRIGQTRMTPAGQALASQNWG